MKMNEKNKFFYKEIFNGSRLNECFNEFPLVYFSIRQTRCSEQLPNPNSIPHHCNCNPRQLETNQKDRAEQTTVENRIERYAVSCGKARRDELRIDQHTEAERFHIFNVQCPTLATPNRMQSVYKPPVECNWNKCKRENSIRTIEIDQCK